MSRADSPQAKPHSITMTLIYTPPLQQFPSLPTELSTQDGQASCEEPCPQTPLPSTPPTQPTYRTAELTLVWDDKEEEANEMALRALQHVERLRCLMLWQQARMEEVYEIFNALSAEWTHTVPLTIKTTIVRYVECLCLGIYLDTAINNEGLAELWDHTIPVALHLLRIILCMVTTMQTSTETVNSRDDDKDPEETIRLVEEEEIEIAFPEGQPLYGPLSVEAQA
uniref:Uncharacterized protein n=1 Tax=Moniliophthora roreri TaxID=221103 RepID=A0A0W0FJL3_MONRR